MIASRFKAGKLFADLRLVKLSIGNLGESIKIFPNWDKLPMRRTVSQQRDDRGDGGFGAMRKETIG
jgi:hypothetical protein